MHPAHTQYLALNQLQQDTHAAELRERAERDRGRRALRAARRSSKEIEAAQHAALAPAHAPAYAPLSLLHGFFGREHGSHA